MNQTGSLSFCKRNADLACGWCFQETGWLRRVSFLLTAEWGLPGKLIQTRAKSNTFEPSFCNSPLHPSWLCRVLPSTFFYIGKCFDKPGTGQKLFITFTILKTLTMWALTKWAVQFWEWNQRKSYLIPTEDFSWLPSQGVERVCVIHMLSVHLPSNYVEFHKVPSRLTIHQKLLYLRKESQGL